MQYHGGHSVSNPPPDLSGKIIVIEQTYFAVGGFAQIWKGRLDPSHRVHWANQVLAIKAFSGSQLPENAEKLRRRLNREASNWHRLEHPNILPLYGICYTKVGTIPDFPALISPFMVQGNISSFICRYPTANRWKLLHEAADGLKYLHDLGLAHGDLKGSNILIRDNFIACLCDFGRTTITGDEDYSKSLIGSAHWTAPELLEAPPDRPIPISLESDIWAFGMVILEVITNDRPWGRLRDFVVLRLVGNGLHPERDRNRGVSDYVWNEVLIPCWQHKPSERPDIQALQSVLP